jgi:hypothetical protein
VRAQGARSTLLARAAIAVVALLLVGWFAVLARDQRVGHAAVHRIVELPNMSPAAWNQAMADLRAADLLDPSTDWMVTRMNFLLLRDRHLALRTAESIVRKEPDNVGAWIVIRDATRDPRRAAEATRQTTRLNPSPPSSR